LRSPITTHRPEDAELSIKREQLAALQTRLADIELQLLNLRLELTEFEAVYHARVAAFYAELDELDALIAEKQARSRPRDSESAEAASDARKRADASRRSANEAPSPPHPVTRSQELKDLYRSAAKRLHPDLATGDADRATRERLMTEANLAYEHADQERLRAILEEYDSSPETIVGSDVGAELVRMIRKINLVNIQIEKIEAKRKELIASELFVLKHTVEDGSQKGIDVLSDLEEALQWQIDNKRQHLESFG
jgi:hypothetical protein